MRLVKLVLPQRQTLVKNVCQAAADQLVKRLMQGQREDTDSEVTLRITRDV